MTAINGLYLATKKREQKKEEQKREYAIKVQAINKYIKCKEKSENVLGLERKSQD